MTILFVSIFHALVICWRLGLTAGNVFQDYSDLEIEARQAGEIRPTALELGYQMITELGTGFSDAITRLFSSNNNFARGERLPKTPGKFEASQNLASPLSIGLLEKPFSHPAIVGGNLQLQSQPLQHFALNDITTVQHFQNDVPQQHIFSVEGNTLEHFANHENVIPTSSHQLIPTHNNLLFNSEADPAFANGISPFKQEDTNGHPVTNPQAAVSIPVLPSQINLPVNSQTSQSQSFSFNFQDQPSTQLQKPSIHVTTPNKEFSMPSSHLHVDGTNIAKTILTPSVAANNNDHLHPHEHDQRDAIHHSSAERLLSQIISNGLGSSTTIVPQDTVIQLNTGGSHESSEDLSFKNLPKRDIKQKLHFGGWVGVPDDNLENFVQRNRNALGQTNAHLATRNVIHLPVTNAPFTLKPIFIPANQLVPPDFTSKDVDKSTRITKQSANKVFTHDLRGLTAGQHTLQSPFTPIGVNHVQPPSGLKTHRRKQISHASSNGLHPAFSPVEEPIHVLSAFSNVQNSKAKSLYPRDTSPSKSPQISNVEKQLSGPTINLIDDQEIGLLPKNELVLHRDDDTGTLSFTQVIDNASPSQVFEAQKLIASIPTVNVSEFLNSSENASELYDTQVVMKSLLSFRKRPVTTYLQHDIDPTNNKHDDFSAFPASTVNLNSFVTPPSLETLNQNTFQNKQGLKFPYTTDINLPNQQHVSKLKNTSSLLTKNEHSVIGKHLNSNRKVGANTRFQKVHENLPAGLLHEVNLWSLNSNDQAGSSVQYQPVTRLQQSSNRIRFEDEPKTIVSFVGTNGLVNSLQGSSLPIHNSFKEVYIGSSTQVPIPVNRPKTLVFPEVQLVPPSASSDRITPKPQHQFSQGNPINEQLYFPNNAEIFIPPHSFAPSLSIEELTNQINHAQGQNVHPTASQIELFQEQLANFPTIIVNHGGSVQTPASENAPNVFSSTLEQPNSPFTTEVASKIRQSTIAQQLLLNEFIPEINEEITPDINREIQGLKKEFNTLRSSSPALAGTDDNAFSFINSSHSLHPTTPLFSLQIATRSPTIVVENKIQLPNDNTLFSNNLFNVVPVSQQNGRIRHNSQNEINVLFQSHLPDDEEILNGVRPNTHVHPVHGFFHSPLRSPAVTIEPHLETSIIESTKVQQLPVRSQITNNASLSSPFYWLRNLTRTPHIRENSPSPLIHTVQSASDSGIVNVPSSTSGQGKKHINQGFPANNQNINAINNATLFSFSQSPFHKPNIFEYVPTSSEPIVTIPETVAQQAPFIIPFTPWPSKHFRNISSQDTGVSITPITTNTPSTRPWRLSITKATTVSTTTAETSTPVPHQTKMLSVFEQWLKRNRNEEPKDSTISPTVHEVPNSSGRPQQTKGKSLAPDFNNNFDSTRIRPYRNRTRNWSSLQSHEIQDVAETEAVTATASPLDDIDPLTDNQEEEKPTTKPPTRRRRRRKFIPLRSKPPKVIETGLEN